MDRTDREIVRLLQTDGRMTHEQISKEISLSRPAVHDRIRRLESAGVIRGYSAQVDWDALGLSLCAFLFVRVTGNCVPIAQKIWTLGTEDAMVQECHRIAGDWCLLLQTRSASTAAHLRLHDEIRAIPGVQNTMNVIALAEVLPDESRVPVPADFPATLATRRN
ncbi:Lrp/AsnC family transcriptional regulator [Fimbriimonas ginsengisoli]|nr:Lrp/AsnC family transcriptional regulator [Fimbriimonas ginsengisoli]